MGATAACSYRAPGRVNLIGEHTDYNDGFVLPAAIDRWTSVEVTRRSDRLLSVHSVNLGQTVTIDPAALARAGGWSDYVAGVVWALQGAGVSVPPVSIVVHSDLPLGAGLSSSAALEVATAAALLDVAHASMDRLTLAVLCQRAENEFVGARCGVMDQFAVTHGRREHALLLDCRSLAHREIRIPAPLKLVICNTMTKHAHSSGEYNRRREECDEALRQLRRWMPHIASLRDVSPSDFAMYGERLPGLSMRRVRHVVTEDDRVSRAAAALASEDLATVAACMAASHRSLRDDYEVSCRELDLMVDLAAPLPGVHGTRMTGGGFGGCTISLVDDHAVAAVVTHVRREYRNETGVTPDIMVCAAADGVQRVVGA